MDQITYCNVPYVDTLVKRASGKVFAVWTERDGVNGLGMPTESVQTFATLHVPQADRRVEAGTRQNEVRVGIVGARASRTPFDCVNLFGMRLQIVHPSVPG